MFVMPIVTIDCREIIDDSSFHEVFARKFGFPDFYGRNMNAWIDCMSYLDSPESGMSTIHCTPGDIMTLHLENITELAPDLYAMLVECAAFVNWRRTTENEPAVLALSYHKPAT
jgi:hypothetical protein